MGLNFSKIYTSNKGYLQKPSLELLSIVTSNLGVGVTEELILTAAPIVIISSVELSNPGRVRVYGSKSAREGDKTRDEQTQPPNNIAILLDTILEEGELRLPVQSSRVWVNVESPQTSNYYVLVTNKGVEQRQLTLTVELSVPSPSLSAGNELSKADKLFYARYY